MKNEKEKVHLEWDCGSAYDLFASLFVLHNPDEFGLRGSWAAGVRSRLPLKERKFLEEAQEVVRMPTTWIYRLPQPKDAQTALTVLKNTASADRLKALVQPTSTTGDLHDLFQKVFTNRRWEPDDIEALRAGYSNKNQAPRPKQAAAILEWWSRPDEFGERYLEALQVYFQVFFQEEERRLQPVIIEALEAAQVEAENKTVPALLEDLSQGVRFAWLSELKELVLVPSFWTTPLIFFERLQDDKGIMLFGARPAELPLVPGDLIPEPLLRGLKALADPTRLRILRYLSEESHTPSELARKLRLRAPTVIHHLNALRLAGLVQLTLNKESERRYSIRQDAVSSACDSLKAFLGKTEDSNH